MVSVNEGIDLDCVVTELKPMSRDERETMVENQLQRYHKALTRNDNNAFLGNQMAILMDKQDATTPLYLTAAVEELVRTQ